MQSYAFIDDNYDYSNGNYESFLKYLKKFHENAYGGKDNIKRIHFIKQPINSYLETEYYTYLINETYGQEIKVTSNRKLFPNIVYDFILFSNNNLFVLDYENNNSWNGAWHVTNKLVIEEVAKWYDSVFEKSVNFKIMLTPKKEIINGMKNLKII